MSFLWVSMSKLRRLFLPLWFLPLFIHCLFSGDVLVNFFWKSQAFSAVQRGTKKRALVFYPYLDRCSKEEVSYPCPIWWCWAQWGRDGRGSAPAVKPYCAFPLTAFPTSGMSCACSFSQRDTESLHQQQNGYLKTVYSRKFTSKRSKSKFQSHPGHDPQPVTRKIRRGPVEEEWPEWSEIRLLCPNLSVGLPGWVTESFWASASKPKKDWLRRTVVMTKRGKYMWRYLVQ